MVIFERIASLLFSVQIIQWNNNLECRGGLLSTSKTNSADPSVLCGEIDPRETRETEGRSTFPKMGMLRAVEGEGFGSHYPKKPKFFVSRFDWII